MDILAPFPTRQPQPAARRRRHAAEPPLWHKIEKFIKFYETDLFCSEFYVEFNKNIYLYQKNDLHPWKRVFILWRYFACLYDVTDVILMMPPAP